MAKSVLNSCARQLMILSSRQLLTRVHVAFILYCLRSLLPPASSPRVSQFGVWRTAWPLFDVSIARSSLQGNKIGIAYKMVKRGAFGVEDGEGK